MVFPSCKLFVKSLTASLGDNVSIIARALYSLNIDIKTHYPLIAQRRHRPYRYRHRNTTQTS